MAGPPLQSFSWLTPPRSSPHIPQRQPAEQWRQPHGPDETALPGLRAVCQFPLGSAQSLHCLATLITKNFLALGTTSILASYLSLNNFFVLVLLSFFRRSHR